MLSFQRSSKWAVSDPIFPARVPVRLSPAFTGTLAQTAPGGTTCPAERATPGEPSPTGRRTGEFQPRARHGLGGVQLVHGDEILVAGDVHRSSSSRVQVGRETQISIWSIAACSLRVSTRSRWSTAPESTRVMQEPQIPS